MARFGRSNRRNVVYSFPYNRLLAASGSAYGPATEADAGATQGALAYTAESGTSVTFTYTKQLEAPFDIIMYLGTGSTSGTLKCAVQVSDDMTEWETIEYFPAGR